jgi:hypothetical protein
MSDARNTETARAAQDPAQAPTLVQTNPKTTKAKAKPQTEGSSPAQAKKRRRARKQTASPTSPASSSPAPPASAPMESEIPDTNSGAGAGAGASKAETEELPASIDPESTLSPVAPSDPAAALPSTPVPQPVETAAAAANTASKLAAAASNSDWLFEICTSWDQGAYSSRSLPRLVNYLNEVFDLQGSTMLHTRVIYKQLKDRGCTHYKGVCVRKLPFMYPRDWEASITQKIQKCHPMTIS